MGGAFECAFLRNLDAENNVRNTERDNKSLQSQLTVLTKEFSLLRKGVVVSSQL